MTPPEKPIALPGTVILHIGSAKAGSTAIQNALDASYEALLEQGVLFPRAILRRSNSADRSRTPGHLDLLQARQAIGLLAEELGTHEGRVHTLLLSIENLLHHTQQAELNRLAELLADSRVHMIAVLRDQISWLESFYYETVVGGIRNVSRPPDAFVDEMIARGILRYDARVSYLGDLFGADRTTVLPYRDTHSKLTLLERFARSADLSLPEMDTLGAARVNISTRYPEAIETHRRLNPLVAQLDREGSQKFSETMKVHYRALDAQGSVAPDRGYLSDTLRKRILLESRAANQALSARLPKRQDLGLVQAAAARVTPPSEPQVGRLFDHGLRALEAHGKAVPDLAQLTSLMALIDRAGVILSLDWRLPLTLAAARPGKLPISLGHDPAARTENQMEYDRRRPRSPILETLLPSDAPDWGALRDMPGFREPDLICLRHLPAGQLDRIRPLLRAPATVVTDQPVTGLPGEICHDIERVGRFCWFTLRPQAAA